MKITLMGSAPGLSVSNRTMLWGHATFTPASHNGPEVMCAGEDYALHSPGKPSFHCQGSTLPLAWHTCSQDLGSHRHP